MQILNEKLKETNTFSLDITNKMLDSAKAHKGIVKVSLVAMAYISTIGTILADLAVNSVNLTLGNAGVCLANKRIRNENNNTIETKITNFTKDHWKVGTIAVAGLAVIGGLYQFGVLSKGITIIEGIKSPS